ncbi:MAG: GNAT family N-acetyltransferase [Clostridia bacterium]|nr:GNAT family N-acetyltransferase [Clostridia bacterium]
MKIEEAAICDAEEILALQKLSFFEEAKIYNDFTITPLLQTVEEIKTEFLSQLFFKCSLDDIIVGSVRAFSKDSTCFIGRLMVHPLYQNRGIGSRLMKEIENHFKFVDRFELFTGFKSDKNIYLYQKLGYRIFKTEEVNDKLKLVYMEKMACK